MADATILKEFLVSLGFKVDQASLKKMDEALDKTAKGVLKFAATLVGATTGVVLFVDHVANRLDNLYWTSKRLHDGVANIQDFQRSLSKLGGDSDTTLTALEGIAQTLRTNPGAEGWLNNIGVRTRDMKGELVGAVEILRQFAHLPMPHWLKANLGEQFGIDENTLLAAEKEDGKTAKTADILQKLYAKLGINADKAAERSKEYANRVRDLRAEFGVFEVLLEEKLIPFADKVLIWMGDMYVQANKVGTPIYYLIQAFNNLGDALNDLSGILKLVGSIATVAGRIIASLPPEAIEFGIIGYFLFGKKGAAILGLLGAVSSLLDKVQGRAEENKPFTDEASLHEAGEGSGHVFARWLNDHGLGYLATNSFNATYEEYKRRQRLKNAPDYSAPLEDPANNSAPPPSRGTGQPLGVRYNNPGNLQPGGREAYFDTAQDGLLAMGRLLVKYAEQGRDTLTSIIAKYAPPDQNDTAAYIATVAKALGVGADSKLNLGDPAVLQGLMEAMIKVEQGVQPYSQAMVGGAAQKALSGDTKLSSGSSQSKTVVINANTKIDVKGWESDSTARAVGREQTRVNGDLARNFAGAAS